MIVFLFFADERMSKTRMRSVDASRDIRGICP